MYQSFVFVVENWRLIFLSNRSDMYLLPTYLKYSCKYIKCDLWFLRTSEYQISFWSQKYINPWLFSNVFCLVNNIMSSILYIRKLCVYVHWFFEKHFYLNSFSTKSEEKFKNKILLRIHIFTEVHVICHIYIYWNFQVFSIWHWLLICVLIQI